jgi:hypothetical protein
MFESVEVRLSPDPMEATRAASCRPPILAVRIIDQAVRDVRNPNGAPIDNASARAFLSGSPMQSYWCEIAELDLNSVIVRARTLMAGCDAGRRSRAGSAEVH